MESVLRCRQCNKPFDKESTLKRHGYYCRSRQTSNVIRNRSCISCAKSKARCNHKQPRCSRCMIKAIECVYPANKRKGVVQKIQQTYSNSSFEPDVTVSLVEESHGHELDFEASYSGDTVLDDGAEQLDQELVSFVEPDLVWDGSDVSLDNLLGFQTDKSATQHFSATPSSLMHHAPPSSHRTSQAQEDPLSSKLWTPLLSPVAIRSLVHRPRMETRSPRVSNLMLRYLRSYPLMMIRKDTVPPFIHPHSIKHGRDHKNMEPLNNCISLMHMLDSRVTGSRKLFWKNVRLECERFCEEFMGMSKWELLSAMQALSMYVIVRLDEGETEYNNFDSLLVAAVSVIAQQSNRSDSPDDTSSEMHDGDLVRNWREWIFAESRTRLCVVYRIVNMLVYFEPIAICDLRADLVIAPLPAKKQLWEAGDESTWRLENEKEPAGQAILGLAANGELVKVDVEQLHCHPKAIRQKSLIYKSASQNTAKWEEWCAGMDEFGGIVMLAASLME